VIGTATTDEGAVKLHAQLKAINPHCSGYKLDVTDEQACNQLFEALQQKQKGLHILVNNAGITRDQLALRLNAEDWQAVIQTNLTAVFRLSRLALKPMMKAREGRIINITSVIASIGNPGQANYAAAKAGVEGMSRALAREVGSRNITVNCVAPGFIETDMTDALPEAQRLALQNQIPLGRLGRVADIAHAVSFLASPQAAYITGTTLHVNGGMYMG
jgi:3-oxoacyl-[acyl-carrier protein] reductase